MSKEDESVLIAKAFGHFRCLRMLYSDTAVLIVEIEKTDDADKDEEWIKNLCVDPWDKLCFTYANASNPSSVYCVLFYRQTAKSLFPPRKIVPASPPKPKQAAKPTTRAQASHKRQGAPTPRARKRIAKKKSSSDEEVGYEYVSSEEETIDFKHDDEDEDVCNGVDTNVEKLLAEYGFYEPDDPVIAVDKVLLHTAPQLLRWSDVRTRTYTQNYLYFDKNGANIPNAKDGKVHFVVNLKTNGIVISKLSNQIYLGSFLENGVLKFAPACPKRFEGLDAQGNLMVSTGWMRTNESVMKLQPGSAHYDVERTSLDEYCNIGIQSFIGPHYFFDRKILEKLMHGYVTAFIAYNPQRTAARIMDTTTDLYDSNFESEDEATVERKCKPKDENFVGSEVFYLLEFYFCNDRFLWSTTLGRYIAERYILPKQVFNTTSRLDLIADVMTSCDVYHVANERKLLKTIYCDACKRKEDVVNAYEANDLSKPQEEATHHFGSVCGQRMKYFAEIGSAIVKFRNRPHFDYKEACTLVPFIVDRFNVLLKVDK